MSVCREGQGWPRATRFPPPPPNNKTTLEVVFLFAAGGLDEIRVWRGWPTGSRSVAKAMDGRERPDSRRLHQITKPPLRWFFYLLQVDWMRYVSGAGGRQEVGLSRRPWMAESDPIPAASTK